MFHRYIGTELRTEGLAHTRVLGKPQAVEPPVDIHTKLSDLVRVARKVGAELLALLGPAGVLTDPADIAPALSDWRSLYQGKAMAVLRPASTEQVAACVGDRCRQAGNLLPDRHVRRSCVHPCRPGACARQLRRGLRTANPEIGKESQEQANASFGKHR